MTRGCNCLNNFICFNEFTLRRDKALTYCTQFNNANGLGWLSAVDNFDGSLIDWDKFFEQRDFERDLIAKGTPRKECEGCHSITEMELETHRKIKFMLLSMWQICNLNCLYCNGHAGLMTEDMPEYAQYYKENEEPYDICAVVEDMLKKDVLEKGALIDFAGGEPTIFPKFNYLLGLFLENGFNNILVHSNATIFSPAILAGVEKNALSLTLSVDAGSREMHNIIKRADCYDIVWENFRRYAEAIPASYSKNLTTKYVIMPDINDKKHEIELWLNKSKENNATNVILNVYDQFLQRLEYEPKLIEHFIELGDFALNEASKLELPLTFFHNFMSVYKAADGLKKL